MSELDNEVKKMEDMYTAYLEQRTKVNNIKIQDVKEKYLGKFIRYYYSFYSNDDIAYQYLFVKNIWYSAPDVYVEGEGFELSVSEDNDNNYFSWSKFIQERMTISDLMENKGENYKIEIISESDFRNAFQENVSMLKMNFKNEFFNLDK